VDEHREAKRELIVGVTAFVRRSDGSVLEGVVQDVSDGGAKILGDPTGLTVGDAIDVVVVVQGEKVRFACEVRHLEPSLRSFGVHFRTGPQPVTESPNKVRRCMQCRRDFPTDCNYCSHCGQKLVTR
jgi:hypothetical protein